MLVDVSMSILVDTREQQPLEFPPHVRVIRGTLTTGDYSLPGLEDLVAIERKELGDLVTCCGVERDRFRRECQRLAAYRCRGIVIEATLADIISHRYRSAMVPQAVIATLTSWSTRYSLPVWFAGDRSGAACIVHTLCRQYLRHLQQVCEAVRGAVAKEEADNGTDHT